MMGGLLISSAPESLLEPRENLLCCVCVCVCECE